MESRHVFGRRTPAGLGLAALGILPRRCALIHVEGLWQKRTNRGGPRAPSAGSSGIERERRWSASRPTTTLVFQELGLFGVADVVEFHPLAEPDLAGVELPGVSGRWQAFPVEYKRGRRRPEMSYLVQLCAQALCLEEMLAIAVPDGALYHGKSRRRQAVTFDDALRGRTRQRAAELHVLVAAGRVPPPQPGPKCHYCSLAPVCVPKLPPGRSAREYLARSVEAILAEKEPP